jgi:tRNA(fMet)-specific endonuclease VapC
MGQVSSHLFSRTPRDIAIPTVVVFELEVGIAKSISPQKRTDQLNELLSTVTVLPFGIKEARSAASIRAQLEKQGKPIGPLDVLIVGTALAHQAILVTHNKKEFSHIKKLVLEDWY